MLQLFQYLLQLALMKVSTINGVERTSFTDTAPSNEQSNRVTVQVTASDGIETTTESVTIRVNDKSGGSMGWIALLLAPAVYLRRRMKRSKVAVSAETFAYWVVRQVL